MIGWPVAGLAILSFGIGQLQAQRFLLPMDVQTYITNAQKHITVTNNPIYGTYTW